MWAKNDFKSDLSVAVFSYMGKQRLSKKGAFARNIDIFGYVDEKLFFNAI